MAQFPHLGSPESSPLPSDDSGGHDGASHDVFVREQDRFLPIANVSRIMKKALPANAKISKDAKDTVQECVSEFISFITGEASDKCQREKRKTINGDDLLWAMSTLGFEDYVEPLKLYLQKYRVMEGEKATMAKGDQTVMKDATNCGASSSLVSGGLLPPAMQQSYVQSQPGIPYGRHEMTIQYKTAMPTNSCNTSFGESHSRGP